MKVMTIVEAAQYTLDVLSNIYDQREAENITSYLFEDLFAISNLKKQSSFDRQEELQDAIKKLQKHEPLQYVTGVAHFFGYKFMVNQHTLIPRPETEELVAWVLEEHPRRGKQLDLLDIGTGSGCIALSFKKKMKSWRVFALDDNMDTINVARINSRRLDAPFQIYNLDFLDEDQWPHLGKFDMIVSNPPYILEEDRKVMADNVLLYEPERALFAGDDPLIFYKKIQLFARDHLLPNGAVYMEIHENLAADVINLFGNGNLDIEQRKDMQGKDRMIRVRYPE